MSKEELELSKDILERIDFLMKLLDENGWELNDDGDIVEKKSKRLVWDIIHGVKDE